MLRAKQPQLQGRSNILGDKDRKALRNQFIAQFPNKDVEIFYELMDPAEPVASFMQLTYLSIPFKLFLLAVAAAGFVVSYFAERQVFPQLARTLGKIHDWLWPQRRKKRKEYKLLQEKMRT